MSIDYNLALKTHELLPHFNYQTVMKVIEAYEAAKVPEQPDDCTCFDTWCASLKDCGHEVQPNSATARQRRLGWDAATAAMNKRESVTQALGMLHDMIDGGEECRGRDSEISDIIRLLEQGR